MASPKDDNTKKSDNVATFISILEQLPEEEMKKFLLYLSVNEHIHKDIISRLDQIEAKLGLSEPTKVIVIEEMDYKVARKRVEEYMTSHKTSDIEILHQNLHIPIEQLIDIIDDLSKEGKIKEE